MISYLCTGCVVKITGYQYGVQSTSGKYVKKVKELVSGSAEYRSAGAQMQRVGTGLCLFLRRAELQGHGFITG